MPLPQLRLENATIRLDDEHHNGKALAFSKVEIINSRIIIGSNDVLIAVRDLIVQDSTVTSGFSDAAIQAAGLISGDLVALAVDRVRFNGAETSLQGQAGDHRRPGAAGVKGEAAITKGLGA